MLTGQDGAGDAPIVSHDLVSRLRKGRAIISQVGSATPESARRIALHTRTDVLYCAPPGATRDGQTWSTYAQKDERLTVRGLRHTGGTPCFSGWTSSRP